MPVRRRPSTTRERPVPGSGPTVSPPPGVDETGAPTSVNDGGMTPDPGSVVDARTSMDVRAADTGPVEVPLPGCGATSPGEIELWVGGLGNCSYPVPMLPMFTAAVDRELYAAGAACGSCLEVSSPRGKVIAVVVDQYPVPPTPRGNKISLGPAALATGGGAGHQPGRPALALGALPGDRIHPSGAQGRQQHLLLGSHGAGVHQPRGQSRVRDQRPTGSGGRPPRKLTDTSEGSRPTGCPCSFASRTAQGTCSPPAIWPGRIP